MPYQQIVEVLGRAEQGVTQPFLCRGEDGHLYYVKGKHASRRSQICEWVAGMLAREFGLPVAPYTVLEVSADLHEALPSDWQEIGVGPAFGSRAVQHALELTWPLVNSVPTETRSDILVFDWWIRNEDRQLTSLGGNPNLLWDPNLEKVIVIDQNQAFDEAFDQARFLEGHIFRHRWPEIVGDCVAMAKYEERMEQAAAAFGVACATCPEEWWWVDEGVPTVFDCAKISTQLLNVSQSARFWEVAK